MQDQQEHAARAPRTTTLAAGTGDETTPEATTEATTEAPAEALAEARRTGRLYRALIEGSLDGVALLAENGRILYVSPSATRVLGYPTDDLVGHSAFDHVHPDDLDLVLERFGRLLSQPGHAERLVVRFHRGDGTWMWVEATATNRLEDPDVRTIVAGFRDVTERVRCEESARERARLEGALLVARTAAHRINNALSPVAGFAELLAERAGVAADPQASRYAMLIAEGAQQAHQEVQRLQHIVRLKVQDDPGMGMSPLEPVLDVERSSTPAD